MNNMNVKRGNEPWKIAGCCRACWLAKRKRCKCRCKGQHHQSGLIKKPTTEEEFKRLTSIFPKTEETNERICQLIEEAIEEHPEWKKLIERVLIH